MALEDLQKDPMMTHLLKSLDEGKDIGHYGRLTFVMVGRHFLDEDELIDQMCKDKDCTPEKARSLVEQVTSRNYNPPRRERILEWSAKQDFPICPDEKDPDACNVYKNLQFPDGLYEHISEYHEEKSESAHEHATR